MGYQEDANAGIEELPGSYLMMDHFFVQRRSNMSENNVFCDAEKMNIAFLGNTILCMNEQGALEIWRYRSEKLFHVQAWDPTYIENFYCLIDSIVIRGTIKDNKRIILDGWNEG